MTFDPKCLDLAQSFLSDVPELDAEKLAPVLAQHIQETIEEFIEGEQVTPSCGCVFCDMGLEPHTSNAGKKVHGVKNRLVLCANEGAAAR
jgi:hypothetical protein